MSKLILYSTNSKEYKKLEIPWEQKSYNVVLGNKCKDDKIIRVNMNKEKVKNTFFTSILYGIKLNSMLDERKRKYVEEKMKEVNEENIKYVDPESITSSFVELFKEYMDENDDEDKNILKLIYNLIQDEEIKAYFEGTFDDEKTNNEKKEEVKDIIIEIFKEIKEKHLSKIEKVKSYTKETIIIYNDLIDRNFVNYLEYCFEKMETKRKALDDYNIVDYLNLYNILMKKDKSLPNLVIIDSATLKLEKSQTFDRIDPNRKCTVLFYFKESNEYERLIYETFLLPPSLFVKNEDYILKKRRNETYYRVYTFPYDHPLIQDLR